MAYYQNGAMQTKKLESQKNETLPDLQDKSRCFTAKTVIVFEARKIIFHGNFLVLKVFVASTGGGGSRKKPSGQLFKGRIALGEKKASGFTPTTCARNKVYVICRGSTKGRPR